jgi:hypothetical protein
MTETRPTKSAHKTLEVLLRAASTIAAGSAGVATALAADPFAGTAVAGAASVGLNTVVTDYAARRLSPHEQARVGAALVFGLVRLRDRIASGEEPREDGFFEGDGEDRSDAETLLDGVLRAAQESWEERRIAYLGYLYSSIAFRPYVSASDAKYLLDTADRLTYRQLICLAVLGSGRRLPDWEGDRLKGDAEPSLLAEIAHLGMNNLIRRNHGQRITDADHFNPAATVRSPLGQLLFETMELSLIPEQDITETAVKLARLADVRWDVATTG